MKRTSDPDRNAPAERAIRPTGFPARTWWGVAKRVAAQSDARNLGLVSAGVAFYSLLSVFPGLAAMIALWGYFADPVMIQEQMEIARQLLPEGAFTILDNQVAALISANTSTLQLTSLFSILLAIWTARNGVAAMIRGLNAIYREEHRRNPLRRYAVAVLLTLVLIGVGIVAFASVVVLPPVLSFFAIPVLTEILIALVKWIVVLLMVFFAISLLYRYGPNRRGARVRWLTPGAVLSLFFWTVGSAAFTIYLRNFGSFNEVYGSLGAVIALLFWLYLSAYVVLLGAQLNAELELSTAHDTTVGAERPPGDRQAFVADHVVDKAGTARLAPSPEGGGPDTAADPSDAPDRT